MANQTQEKRSRGRPRSVWSDKPAQTVQALDRAMVLLAALAADDKATLTELALKTGMSPSTAHRLLTTLQRHNVVEFDEASQDWMVGVEAFRIGSSFLRRTRISEAGREVMRALMEDTGETSNMAIADEGDVVFVSQVETHHPIRAFYRPGTRGHMHASGIGKALLAAYSRTEVEKVLQKKGLPSFTSKTLASVDALMADLEAARARGWALDDEEANVGMRCLAAPIYNEHGEPVAGVSISGPTARIDDERLGELGPRVRRAAEEITALIGGEAPRREE